MHFICGITVVSLVVFFNLFVHTSVARHPLGLFGPASISLPSRFLNLPFFPAPLFLQCCPYIIPSDLPLLHLFLRLLILFLLLLPRLLSSWFNPLPTILYVAIIILYFLFFYHLAEAGGLLVKTRITRQRLLYTFVIQLLCYFIDLVSFRLKTEINSVIYYWSYLGFNNIGHNLGELLLHSVVDVLFQYYLILGLVHLGVQSQYLCHLLLNMEIQIEEEVLVLIFHVISYFSFLHLLSQYRIWERV